MTADPAREDASLTLPEMPGLRRELGRPEYVLSRDAPVSEDRSFELTGARARSTGSDARGVDEVVIPPVRLLSLLRVEDARALSSTVTPVGVERSLAVGAETILERIVVPRGGPVCFFEWATDGAGVLIAMTWETDLQPGASLGWRAAERGLVVEGAGHRGLFFFSQPAEDLAVTPVDGGGIRVRVALRLAAGGTARLAAAAVAPGDEEDRVVAAMDRTHVAVPARQANARRMADERLSVEGPVPGMGEAMEWAKVRLSSYELGGAIASDDGSNSGRGSGVDRASADRIQLALASLAVGARAPARRLLEPGEDGSIGAATGGGPAALAYLHLAARYLAWTGDRRVVLDRWNALRTIVERYLAGSAGTLASGPVLRELVVAAEEIDDADMAGRLRGAADAMESGAGRPGAGVEWSVAPDTPSEAAALALAWTDGVLGVQPDAARGRLVLRPRLPEDWDRLKVRNLTPGGASVRLAYERVADAHRFTLGQERGAAPLQVVFEPELSGEGVASARVDAESADLDARKVEGRWRVPVQVVLDHERRVEVEMRPVTD